MSDETEDQNKKAKELQENFAKAMSKEEPVKGQVLSMEGFLMRRFEKQNAKAQEHLDQAHKVNAGHLSELKNDPFAAPVLRLARQEADKAEETRKHIVFIQTKENEARIAEMNKPAEPVQQIATVIPLRQNMGWGIPGLTPTKK